MVNLQNAMPGNAVRPHDPRAKIENFGYDCAIQRQPGRFTGGEARMLNAHVAPPIMTPRADEPESAS
jgi:hypothetical protein